MNLDFECPDIFDSEVKTNTDICRGGYIVRIYQAEITKCNLVMKWSNNGYCEYILPSSIITQGCSL